MKGDTKSFVYNKVLYNEIEKLITTSLEKTILMTFPGICVCSACKLDQIKLLYQNDIEICFKITKRNISFKVGLNIALRQT